MEIQIFRFCLDALEFIFLNCDFIVDHAAVNQFFKY